MSKKRDELRIRILLTIKNATNNDAYICKYMSFSNELHVYGYRHYIIRRGITTKLYIVHYGYVIEVIFKYSANT